MVAGLATAEKQVKSWTGRVGDTLKSWGGTLWSYIAYPFQALGSMLWGMVTKALTPTGNLKDKFKELGDEIKAARQQSIRLGTSVSDYMELAAAFGPVVGGVDQLNVLLAKLRVTGRGGDLVEDLAHLADRISKIEDPSERARVAVERMGRSGVAALSFLTLGAEGFRKKLQQIRDLGVSVTDEEAGIVAKAGMGFKQIELAWKGLWTRIVVAVSPAVAAVGDALLMLAPTIRKVGEFIGEFIGIAIQTVVFFFDALIQRIKAIYEQIGGAKIWATFRDVAIDSLKAVAYALADFFDLLLGSFGALAAMMADVHAIMGHLGKFFGTISQEELEKTRQTIALLRKVSAATHANWGKTKELLAKMFDGLKKKGTDTAKAIAQSFAGIGNYVNEAILGESKEAQVIENRWRVAAMLEVSPITGDKVVAKLDEVKKVLLEIRDKPAPKLEVVGV